MLWFSFIFIFIAIVFLFFFFISRAYNKYRKYHHCPIPWMGPRVAWSGLWEGHFLVYNSPASSIEVLMYDGRTKPGSFAVEGALIPVHGEGVPEATERKGIILYVYAYRGRPA